MRGRSQRAGRNKLQTAAPVLALNPPTCFQSDVSASVQRTSPTWVCGLERCPKQPPVCAVQGARRRGGGRRTGPQPGRAVPPSSVLTQPFSGREQDRSDRGAWGPGRQLNSAASLGPKSELSLHPWVLWPLLLRENGAKLAVGARSRLSWSLCSDKSLFFPGPQFPCRIMRALGQTISTLPWRIVLFF